MNKYKIDQLIELSGDTWRVSCITKSFIIITRNSVEGEPENSEDVMKVDINEFMLCN